MTAQTYPQPKRTHTLDCRRPAWFCLRSEESGQMLIMFAFAMLVMMAMLGLIVDMGMGYAMQKRMQTAADTAALAGAHTMARQQTQEAALNTIENMLRSNGASVDLSDYQISGGEVAVTARMNQQAFFLPIFGMGQMAIGASATATWGALQKATNLMPFAVEEAAWVAGETVQLNPPDRRQVGAGNFAWLHWDGQQPSVPTLVDNITYPADSGQFAIGDSVASGDPGDAMNNPQVVQALEAYIGQTITVPLYDLDQVYEQGNNFVYTIIGFAHFQLTTVDRRHNLIEGTWISTTSLADPLLAGNPDGIQSVGLIR